MAIGIFVLFTTLAAQAAAPAPPASTDAVGQAYLLFVQGRMLEGRDDVAGATAAYRKALEILPGSAEVHAELAGLFARQGKAAEAIAEAQTALKIEPKNHEASRTLGLVQSQLAESGSDPVQRRAFIKEAIGHLEVALADRFVDPSAQFTLGRLYVESGDFAKGIEMLRLFLLDQPGYPDGILLLAKAYEWSGNPSEGIGALQELVAADPDQVRAWSTLGELYEQTEKWQDAAAAWSEVSKRDPRNADARNGRARALVSAGDLAAGRQALVDATRSLPRDIDAWFLLSEVERRAGNSAAAEDAARHIAEIDPADPRGPLAIAETKSARGDYRGALDALTPLAAKRPTASVIQDRLGDICFQLKLYREAADAWDRALSGDRDGIDIAAVTRKRDRARELAK